MKQLLKNLAFALLCAGLHTATAQAQGPTLDPSFVPTVALPARTGQLLTLATNDVVRQPDGKLIVAGSFSQINNVSVSYLCRLLPNGQVDATFATAGPNGTVRSVALQPDGKLVIGGDFTAVGRQPRNGLARLLPNGTLDTGFTSPFGIIPIAGLQTAAVRKVVLQPGAGILVTGGLNTTAAVAAPDARLVRVSEATGALDPSFQRVPSTAPGVFDVLVQPNGHLVLAGQPRPFGSQLCSVWGTLPNGAPDPAFVPLPDTTSARNLVRDPTTGNIYADANDASGVVGSGPLRLRPNGTLDPTFNATGALGPGGPLNAMIWSLAVQPNGRLLLGGNIYDGSRSYGTWRLMPNGTRDGSYQPGNGPVVNSERVYKVLVQPDGALVFGGSFDRVGSSPRDGLARMLDPNVLAISNQKSADDDLTAWPVPAHDVLHLRLAAPGGDPVRLTLLDALGRVVRQQDAAHGQTALALPTAGLPPGTYLLRVAYPSGPVLRRVTVE